MKTVTLDIAGMACEGCANTVRTALVKLDGVRRTDVSLEEATARVTADDEVEEASLVEAVSASGYGATVRR